MTDVKELITEHLDIWLTAEAEKKSGRGRSSGSSNSIYGVQKLRELILELALTGKLIKTTSEWKKYTLDEIGIWAIGSAFPKTAQGEQNKEILFCKVSDMNLKSNEKYINYTNNSISSQTAKQLKTKVHNNGTVIFPKIGGAIATNKRRIITQPTAIDNNCLGISPYEFVDPEWLYLLLSNIDFSQYQAGTSVPALQQSKISKIEVYIPSLNDQNKVIEEICIYQQLCDQLEQQQNLSSEAHDQLVDTLLSVLTNSSDVDEFQQNWQRISENFDLLFTTEYSIEQLKQTILQLAIRGKLVKQDPNDEPASELLKQITEEKARLVKEGRIKKSKPLSEITDEEKSFELPSGWVYTKIADFCRPISSGSTPSADKFTHSGIPFLKVYNIRDQKIDFSYKEQFVDDEIHKGKLSRSRLYPNDVVMNIVGPPLGKIAIIPNDYPEWNCNQAIVFFGVLIPEISEYLYTYLCEGSFLKQIELIGTAGQDNISVTKSQNIVMPLPPLKEQKRIVEKVSQLFSLIEQFQSLKLEVQKTKLYLADGLIANVLSNSNNKNETEATDNIVQFERPSEIVKKSKQKSSDQIDLFANESVEDDVKLLSLAAEITFQLHTEPTFGHLKLQKLIYLCQQLKHMDLAADFKQHAAGPYDRNIAIYIDTEFKKRQWFSYHKDETPKYKQLRKCGEHKTDFERFFVKEASELNLLLGLFRTSKSDHIEIVATLFACWLRLLEQKQSVTEEQLLKDFYAWSEEKKKFTKDEVLNGYKWMHQYSVIPQL
ncbi:restriction endonuclease subunit S [Acinetobacter calcoaceticus]|uniref:restriction endonuclease subunit S n=1 Tax=Acinetobacter calcoaceticus TaxID=471 RepID=UPI002275EF99|nr:restriction endonuclease subunit S [Acinetobacter calcoaceticus]GLG82033.1 hypothetical protein ACSO1_05550 [Acinetobacter calcoaceticus]